MPAQDAHRIPDIETARLSLRLMDRQFLMHCLLAEQQQAANLLGVPLPDDWLGQWQLMALHLKELKQDPAFERWGLRAVLHRHSGQMIGQIGFHSSPDPDYLTTQGIWGIELGYEIYPAWRRQGLAREAVTAMLELAQQQGVNAVVLTIAPDNKASIELAESLGFERQTPIPGADPATCLYRLKLAGGS